MTAIGNDLEPGRGRSRSDLYARRPVPVLAGRLGDEPRPAWLEELIREGRLWVDRRGWHAGSDEGRVDLDPEDYVIFDESGELRTCHPPMFRILFEPFASPRPDGGAEDATGAPGDGEWAEHRLRWLEAALPDGVEFDGRGLHALRPIPVLAARLVEEPWPDWLRLLWDEGRIWRDGRGYHAGSGADRIDLRPEEYLVMDAAGELRTCHPETFRSLFDLYQPVTYDIGPDDVILGTVYREGQTKHITGRVRGWDDVRWELSADPDGKGFLRVFSRDLAPDGGPSDVWTRGLRVDPELVRDALGKGGPAARTPAQMELAGVVADALSMVDASVVARELLDEFERRPVLPHGHGR